MGVSPVTPLGVYNNNLNVGYRAFAERYFLVKTDAGFETALAVNDSEYFSDKHLRAFWSRVVSEFQYTPVATPREVVQSYSGTKLKLYTSALLEYERDGITERAGVLSSFVKFEKQDLFKAPRVINPRSRVFNLLLGCYLKFQEKKFFKSINVAYGERTTSTVIKGMDVFEQGRVLREKWDVFADPVAVGLDASKFDMHVSVAALKYEHTFYTGAFRKLSEADIDAEILWYNGKIAEKGAFCGVWADTKDGFRDRLAWLLRQQLSNRGKAYFADGTLKFRMEGTRSSGDLNTSLGNCLIMCSLVKAWAGWSGVDVELANNGDDCVVFMERKSLDAFMRGLPEWFRTKGFRMTVEKPVYEFEEVEFCQSHPVWDGGAWRMVRNVEATLVKSAMCLLPLQNNAKILRKWFGAVGDCEGVLNSGIPVLQEFAAMYRRVGLKCSREFQSEVYKGSTRAYHMVGKKPVMREITVAARVSFWKAFGILPDHQQVLESWYRDATIDMTITHVEADDAAEKRYFIEAPIMQLVRTK